MAGFDGQGTEDHAVSGAVVAEHQRGHCGAARSAGSSARAGGAGSWPARRSSGAWSCSCSGIGSRRLAAASGARTAMAVAAHGVAACGARGGADAGSGRRARVSPPRGAYGGAVPGWEAAAGEKWPPAAAFPGCRRPGCRCRIGTRRPARDSARSVGWQCTQSRCAASPDARSYACGVQATLGVARGGMGRRRPRLAVSRAAAPDRGCGRAGVTWRTCGSVCGASEWRPGNG